MLSLSHTAVAMAIASDTDNAYIAAPLAFGSHFALDILPHYGAKISRKYLIVLCVIDNLLALFLMGFFIYLKPQKSVIFLTAAFFAVLPDLTFIPNIFWNIKKPAWFWKFHSAIQKLEFSGGFVFDIAVVFIVLFLLWTKF